MAHASSKRSDSKRDAAVSFNVHAISLNLQQKLMSVLPNQVVRLFLDEAAVRLFDNICRALAVYMGSTAIASKYTKRIVKMNMRIEIFAANEKLSKEEMELSYDFHEKCHYIAEIVVKLAAPHARTLATSFKPTIDTLLEAIQQAETLALQIGKAHLDDATVKKFSEALQCFCDKGLFTALFGDDQKYTEYKERIYDDLQDLLDRGIF